MWIIIGGFGIVGTMIAFTCYRGLRHDRGAAARDQLLGAIARLHLLPAAATLGLEFSIQQYKMKMPI